MTRLAPLFALIASFVLPAAAQAACTDALSAAADEVQGGEGLSPGRLRDVRGACGDAGPASLVATLVARGACDQAAQLARSLPGQRGMEGAQASADRCLSQDLDDALVALDNAAEDPAWEPRAEASAADGAQPYGGASGRLGGLTGGEAELGDLGSRGSGAGGSGRAAASPRRSRAATGMAPSAAAREKIGYGAPVAYSRLSLGVWFDTDSAALRPEALGTVGTLAEQLRRMDGGAVLEIAGHTDSTGAWSYNADLSARRARAVQQALILAGVPRDRLTVIGLGEDQPVASNDSYWGRAQNRRVEFRFYKAVAVAR
jgi:outer membrane protein OmpA-like peptidoglycan-associated protein